MCKNINLIWLDKDYSFFILIFLTTSWMCNQNIDKFQLEIEVVLIMLKNQ